MLQISAMTVLTVTNQKLTESSKDLRNLSGNNEESQEKKIQIIPYVMLFSMNIVPVIFIYGLYRHRHSLQKEHTRTKIGSLYQTVQPTSISSLSYSIHFQLIVAPLFVQANQSPFRAFTMLIQL